MDSRPSAVLPPGCLFWGAWTSALLPLLVQGLQGALPSIRERRGGWGGFYIPGFGVRPKPGFREWSLVSGGWDIIPSTCWPRLRGGVTSLTLTLRLGVPLRTLWTISAMQEWMVFSPSGSRWGPGCTPRNVPLCAGEAPSSSAAGRMWMRAGHTHLHTDPSVWKLGSQRAWLTYAMSVMLVPRGERNSSWHRMSLRWSSRNQLPWLAF